MVSTERRQERHGKLFFGILVPVYWTPFFLEHNMASSVYFSIINIRERDERKKKKTLLALFFYSLVPLSQVTFCTFFNSSLVRNKFNTLENFCWSLRTRNMKHSASRLPRSSPISEALTTKSCKSNSRSAKERREKERKKTIYMIYMIYMIYTEREREREKKRKKKEEKNWMEWNGKERKGKES